MNAAVRPAEGTELDASGNYHLEALHIISEVSASLADEDDVEELLGRFLGTMIRLANANAGAVRVLTRHAGAAAEVLLEFPARLDFGRAEVQRSLLLSRAIIEPLGARLAFRQEHGPRLQIKLAWPAGSGKA